MEGCLVFLPLRYSVADSWCLPRIPDQDFSIPDLWSGFYSSRIRIFLLLPDPDPQRWIDKEIKEFQPKVLLQSSLKYDPICLSRTRIFPSRILDPWAKKHWIPDPDPQHWLRYRKVVRFLSCKFSFSHQRIGRKIGMFMLTFQLDVQYIDLFSISCWSPVISSSNLVPLYLHTSIIYILHLSLSFSLSVSRLNDVAPLPPPPRAPSHSRAPESPPPVGQTQVREQQQDALLPTWCVQVTAFLYSDFLNRNIHRLTVYL